MPQVCLLTATQDPIFHSYDGVCMTGMGGKNDMTSLDLGESNFCGSGNSTENGTSQQCDTPPGAHKNNHSSVNTTENHTSQLHNDDATPGFDMNEPGVVGTCDEDKAGNMGLGADQMPAAVCADQGSLDDNETTDNQMNVYISQPQPNVDLWELSDIALLEDMKHAMDFI